MKGMLRMAKTDELNIDQLLHIDMVFLDVEAENKEDLLTQLVDKAYSKGYVKDTFLDAVLERENLYPTALPTSILKVAVPHAIDRSLIIKPVILLAKLKHPVVFKEMGEGVKDIAVDIVFLLAVNGPRDQLCILQKVVGMFSNVNAMQAIKEAHTKKDLIDAVKSNLDD